MLICSYYGTKPTHEHNVLVWLCKLTRKALRVKP